jgi:hypothetical protein
MNRTPNKSGGGANTNVNGLHFEATTHLKKLLVEQSDYVMDNQDQIVKNGIIVGEYFEKYGLYKKLLSRYNIDHNTIISKKLLPDAAILVGNTIYIIEKKYQNGAGSVDEKLQTCDFKKRQYKKLFSPIGIQVEYYYVLSNFFNKDCYKDVFEYITDVGCKYFFEVLPLEEIGL